MAFITLEPGGPRPPTEQEKLDIRAALEIQDLPAGGAVGEMLVKNTTTDGDASWGTAVPFFFFGATALGSEAYVWIGQSGAGGDEMVVFRRGPGTYELQVDPTWDGSASYQAYLKDKGGYLVPVPTYANEASAIIGEDDRTIYFNEAEGMMMATPGTEVPGTGTWQPLDAELSALAGLVSAADTMPYFTGSGTAALASLTAYGRQIAALVDAGAAQTLFGVDPAGTDNSTPVSLAGQNYLSIVGQVITAGQVSLSGSHVTGILTTAKGGTGFNTYTHYDLLYGSIGGGLNRMGIGTGRQVLRVNTAGTAFSWESIERSKSITIVSPAVGENLSLFYTNKPLKMTQMRAVLRGSSSPQVTWTVKYDPNRSAPGTQVVVGGTPTTSTTTGSNVTSFDNATIPADSFVWFEITVKSGIVEEFQLTAFYEEE